MLGITTAFASGWQGNTQYNDGVNIKPVQGGQFSFVFPSSSHVNLIGHPWKSVKPGTKITITYKIAIISGKPKFISLDPAPSPPSLKPNFRPMLFNGDMAGSDSRFWPAGGSCAWLIADGLVHTYSVKLSPTLWTNVWGQYNADGFKNLCGHLYEIDLAFGGGNSFSHGIKVKNGSAQFQLIGFKIK